MIHGQRKTNKKYTMEVLTSAYISNIGTDKEEINSEYLCHTLSLEMKNNQRFTEEVATNTRRKIEAICWEAFNTHVNNLLKWYYGAEYYATSAQLKAFIKNDYSVLNELYEDMKSKRYEYQMYLLEERKINKKVS